MSDLKISGTFNGREFEALQTIITEENNNKAPGSSTYLANASFRAGFITPDQHKELLEIAHRRSPLQKIIDGVYKAIVPR